jgi:hypothetical protein
MAGNILEELEFNAGDLIKVSQKIRIYGQCAMIFTACTKNLRVIFVPLMRYQIGM